MTPAPITYTPNFVSDPDVAFSQLRDELSWERRTGAPRSEYYCNDFPVPYAYGRRSGRRSYDPRPWHPAILSIREALHRATGAHFDVCFLNRYHDQSDQLGWHADDSPEMDDARPIAVVSLGVEREIWFRSVSPCFRCDQCGVDSPTMPEVEKRHFHHKMSCYTGQYLPATEPASEEVEKLKLGHGSMCLMAAGMQDAWEHRIPKASFLCGERISLTFRGFVSP